ncbi:hypothetical protein MPH_08581 [Macrophomina phaseolina MS6]|uniref:Uncharacterized protein n=1 Tax=Macrophomina phaseolina (strain MS6) TaxID=1126212 RepID=K2RI08_MACPH|nr:hypothetical protein MPH_08581 [Macrophomina phaseolina MS6]
MAKTSSSNSRKDSVVGVESDHESFFTSDRRPVTSPYCSGFSKVAFGQGSVAYYVLSCLLARYPKLENLQAFSKFSPRIELPEVYAGVGHTLVHFLFTGRYQTLRSSEAPNEDEDDVEYGRALMTYAAARAYDLNDLACLAQGKAQSHGDALKISSALDHIKAVVSAGLSNDEWLDAHLNEKLGAFFREPDELFDIQDLVSCVGEALAFNKKLVEVLGQMVRGIMRPHNDVEDVIDEDAEATDVTEPAQAEKQEWAEPNTESDDCEGGKGKHNAPESDHGEPDYLRNEKSIGEEDPSAVSPEPPAPDGPVEEISVDPPENREFTRNPPPAEEDACDGRGADASVEHSTPYRPAAIEVSENDLGAWQESTENDEWAMPTRKSKKKKNKEKKIWEW